MNWLKWKYKNFMITLIKIYNNGIRNIIILLSYKITWIIENIHNTILIILYLLYAMLFK